MKANRKAHALYPLNSRTDPEDPEATQNTYTKVNVLVLAPMFPNTNQAWMDRYIEQLLLKGFTPLIYTENKSPGKYHEKVDKLNLRSYIIKFDLNETLSLIPLINEIILHPLTFLASTCKALTITRYLFKKYSLSIIPTFIKLLRFGVFGGQLEQIDVIHSHNETLAFEFMLFALMKRIPLLYTFHGLPPKGVSSIAHNKRRALYGEVSVVLVNTNFSKQQISRIGCPTEKVTILPQGLPITDFAFLPRSAPSESESLSLLTVGRLHHDKGQRYAILALRRLIDSGVSSHWHFVGADSCGICSSSTRDQGN